MPDPAEVEGSDVAKRRAFNEAFLLIKLERLALEQRVRAIGGAPESARSER
jgi:hypothetical protein